MRINWYYNGPLVSSEQDGHAVVNVNLIKQVIENGEYISFTYFNPKPCSKTELFISSLGVESIRWEKRSLRNRLSNLLFGWRSRADIERGICVYGANAVLDMALNLLGSHNILIAGDVETRKWYQNKRLSNFPKFIVSWVREAYYSIFDVVYIYNRRELSFIRPSVNVEVYPVCYNAMGVLIDERPLYDLIFTGNFNYEPNRLAAKYILDNFSGKGNSICLAGYAADSLPSSYPDVILKPNVPSLEEEIQKSKLYISPLSMGTGVKNKILSAVNCSVPVLCSEISAEGIDLVEDDSCRSVRICHSLKEYQDGISEFLKNYECYKADAIELKKVADQKMSWGGFGDNFLMVLKGLR